MLDTTLYLLEELLESIEDQIQAAKKLDIENLTLATQRRQDLIFELEVEHDGQPMDLDDEILDLRDQIELADQRLLLILETVVQITKKTQESGSGLVYDKNGTIQT